jgi:hypothetical protein
MELLCFETLTLRNYYTFSDATLSDNKVVLCYVLSQYRVYKLVGAVFWRHF